MKSIKKLGGNLEELGKLEDLDINLSKIWLIYFKLLDDIQQRHGKGWEFLFSSFKRFVNLRNLSVNLCKLFLKTF